MKTGAGSIRILLADDHKIFVNGLGSLLENEPGLEISGLAYDGQVALDKVRLEHPDLLITDVSMPGLSGIGLTKMVKEEFPETCVIGLSMFDKPEIINELIEAGADGYLLKDIEKDELVHAIHEVMEGRMYYSGSVAKTLMHSLSNKDLLTAREKQIIALIAQELTNNAIANKLFISEHTVEAHRKNIFRKTKAKSLVGLIKYAFENKLV